MHELNVFYSLLSVSISLCVRRLPMLCSITQTEIVGASELLLLCFRCVQFCVLWPHMLAASQSTPFVWTEIIFGVVGVENLFDLIIMSASEKGNNSNNMASPNYLESKHMKCTTNKAGYLSNSEKRAEWECWAMGTDSDADARTENENGELNKCFIRMIRLICKIEH